MSDDDALLAALSGGDGTMVDQLDDALAVAWRLSTGLNIPVPATGGAPGPYRAGKSPWDLAVDQTCARWGAVPKARTMAEKAALLEALVAGIDAARKKPAPTPAPPADLPPGTTQGQLKWAADLTKGDVIAAGFKSTPWNTEHGPTWPPPIGTYAGRRAVKFQLGSGGKRIEVEPNHQTFGSSGSAWFGFQFYLESDFPLAASSWHVIWQLHGNDTISPRFALQAHKGGLTVGDNGALVPIAKQRWYQAVVHADFSAGRISVWLDGTKVVDSYDCGRSNPDYYLKVGSYQDTAIGAGTLYQANYRLGTGYGAVAIR